MRAYHATVDRDDVEADAWVVRELFVIKKPPTKNNKQQTKQITQHAHILGLQDKSEFHELLVNLFVFNKLFDVFADIDKDHDRRIDFAEFSAGAGKLDIPAAERRAVFDAIDLNHGGMILFDEFCLWFVFKYYFQLWVKYSTQVWPQALPQRLCAC
jgi:hypothetical protein